MSHKTTEELIEELALSVGRGFAEQQERMQSLRTEVQEGFVSLAGRLDRIEFLVNGQEQRLTVLEDKVRQLGTKLGYQFN